MLESNVFKKKDEDKEEENDLGSKEENLGFFGSVMKMVSFGGGAAEAKAPGKEDQAMSDDEDDERNRSMEKCDSDELDGDMNLSDDEQEAANYRTALRAKKLGKTRREYK